MGDRLIGVGGQLVVIDVGKCRRSADVCRCR